MPFSINGTASKNRLVAALPQADALHFAPDVHLALLRQHQVLYQPGAPIKCAYFVEEGLTSVLTEMANGSTVEVGMIGIEGMVGVSALFGAQTSAQQIIVQFPGTAMRMDAVRCKAVFDQSAAMRRLVYRFAEAFMNLSAQTAACNALHSIQQRCARWLLMASDRIRSNTMPITHEFLSSMLGVRRAGVTEIAGELQRSGLIRYHRGQLTIIDREGLEATACECYQLDHARFEGLLRE